MHLLACRFHVLRVYAFMYECMHLRIQALPVTQLSSNNMPRPSRAHQLPRPSRLPVLPRHPEGTRSGSLELTGGVTFLLGNAIHNWRVDGTGDRTGQKRQQPGH